MKQITLVVFFFLVAIKGMAQEKATITGIVKDEQGLVLPGVSIIVEGTTDGTITDGEGQFLINTAANQGNLIATSVGFKDAKVAFTTSTEKIEITLKAATLGLDEIVIFSSRAVDRKTPVAVSTIKKEDIDLKLGSQEFVEILKSTPGVYTSKAGGGFGDGEVQMRGFTSENVGVLINGVPVNDMENGRVFWSNWASLGSVTSSTEAQRGLGASKVAVPAIGGTINVVTQTTDAEEGGEFSYGIGNNGYTKYGFKYSTGLTPKGLAVTVYGDRNYGNGFVDGTFFDSVSYFANISYVINSAHKLSFTAFGATQRHGQRQNKSKISDIRSSERGIQYNPDWGYKQGQITSIRDNFYNKPQVSLNHFWTINQKNKLSTAAYVSFGTGGGGTTSGSESSKFTNNDYRIGTLGPVNLDKIVAENQAQGANGSSAILMASRNDHFWAGVLSTLHSKIGENFSLVNGIDARTYTGKHFQEITDLLGGQYSYQKSDVNNLNIAAKVGDKINYNNDGQVNSGGVFSQLEYERNKFTVFGTLNLSTTDYKRIDYFQKTPGNQASDNVNFLGGGFKAGLNYRLNDYNNVFINSGFFQRAPTFGSVWPTNNNDQTNKDAKNQKIFSFELGYGLRLTKFTANVNAYYTRWNDKTNTQSFQQPDGTTAFANITGVNALHKGVEFDFEYHPFEHFKVTGMLSLGDWKWDNNIENVPIIDQNQVVLKTVSLFIKDTPVGGAAQTTAALGLNYLLDKTTTFGVDYNFYDKFYAYYDPTTRGTQNVPAPWKLPSFHLFDAVISHKFNIKTFDAKITARMNNVFNTKYVSVANDTDGTAQGALVYYGFGRTFSIGTTLNF